MRRKPVLTAAPGGKTGLNIRQWRCDGYRTAVTRHHGMILGRYHQATPQRMATSSIMLLYEPFLRLSIFLSEWRMDILSICLRVTEPTLSVYASRFAACHPFSTCLGDVLSPPCGLCTLPSRTRARLLNNTTPLGHPPWSGIAVPAMAIRKEMGTPNCWDSHLDWRLA